MSDESFSVQLLTFLFVGNRYVGGDFYLRKKKRRVAAVTTTATASPFQASNSWNLHTFLVHFLGGTLRLDGIR